MASDTVIAFEVLQECDRQVGQWGEQDHDEPSWLAILAEEVGECARHCCPSSPSMPDDLRKELIQVAAVAVSWIKALDRRRKG